MFRRKLFLVLGLILAVPASSFAEPTVQASNITFPNVAGRSMRISWTRGNGDGSIVILREDPPNARVDPVDLVDYSANPDYTLAQELPPQNFVVYKGSGNLVLVTGLVENTNYSVAVYEYDGAGASTDYLQSIPAEGSETTTGIPVHNEDFRVDCTDCHYHGSFGARGPELKAVCSTCHNPSGLASAKLEFGFEEGPTTTGHTTPTKNVDVDIVDCGMCHELHNPGGANTTESFNDVTSVTKHNNSFLRANVDKYVSTASPPAYLHTDQPLRAVPHPDGDVAADTPDRAVEGGNDTTATGYCQVCHSLTNYHRSTDTGVSDQCHNGGGSNCGPAETHCGACHEHNNNFEGSGDCTACHSSPQGTAPVRPTITTQFDDRPSSHVSPVVGGVTQEDCLVCHDHITHQAQTVRMNDPDGGASHSQPTAGDPTLASGEGEAFAPACLGCHDSDGATRLAGGDPGQTPLSPFTDSPPPPIFDDTAWSNASHNRPVLTSGSSPVTCIGDGTNGCHGSGHGSEQNTLLAPADVAPDLLTTVPATVFCLVCHDSDGPSTKNIAAEFDTGTNFQTVADSGALVNQRHDVTKDDQDYSAGAVTCKDCHRPHEDAPQSIVDPGSGFVVQSNPVAHPDTGTPLPVYSMENHYVGDATTTAVSNVTKGNPTTITTSVSHGWISGDTVCISGIVDNGPGGDLEAVLNGNSAYTITVTSATAFTIPEDTSGLTNVYASGGTATRSDTCFTYYDGTDAFTDLDPTNPEGGTLIREPDYIEFCLVCHDGTAPAGVTMPTAMLNMADSYRLNDQHGRLEGRSSSSRGYLKQPWSNLTDYEAGNQPGGGNSTYAALNCTLCHSAHGSGNAFNLRTSVTVNGVAMTVGGKDAFKDPALCTKQCGNINNSLPEFGSTTYTLPVQEHLSWGAWCTFCHEPSHGTSDGTGCQAGHLHGGGNF